MADDERGNASEACGDSIGQGVAIQWRHFCCTKICEWKHHKGILLRAIAGGFAKPLRQH